MHGMTWSGENGFMNPFGQDEFRVRFEWGPRGARELAQYCKVVVIVDVLSFTTAVETAVSQGAKLYPFRWQGWQGPGPEDFAREIGAIAAVKRSLVTPEKPFSLSPQSMLNASAGMRVVLPSPNGAEVTLAAADSDATVLAGSLRNAGPVAEAALRIGEPIAVVASGEQWDTSGILRPSFEDLIGAGAIISALGAEGLSPEARAAAEAYQAVAGEIPTMLAQCSSGRELIGKGYERDVTWASMLNVSNTVPELKESAFVRS